MALLTVLALLALVWAVAGVPDGDWMRAIGGAVLALVLGSASGFLVVAARRGSGATVALAPWPGGDGRAVRFGYSISAYCLFSLLAASCVLVMLCVGAATGAVLGVVMVAVAALLGWYLVAMLRRAPGGLLLSPDGLAHRGLTSFYAVPWDAVRGVETWRLGTWALVVKADPSPQSVLRRYTGRFDTGELEFLPFLVVRTYWLAADPEVVRRTLAFYLAHPELRDELGTPEAVRRIAEGRTGG
ncbi:hypothetical protein [Micromonospora sp. NPDC003776]